MRKLKKNYLCAKLVFCFLQSQESNSQCDVVGKPKRKAPRLTTYNSEKKLREATKRWDLLPYLISAWLRSGSWTTALLQSRNVRDHPSTSSNGLFCSPEASPILSIFPWRSLALARGKVLNGKVRRNFFWPSGTMHLTILVFLALAVAVPTLAHNENSMVFLSQSLHNTANRALADTSQRTKTAITKAEVRTLSLMTQYVIPFSSSSPLQSSYEFLCSQLIIVLTPSFRTCAP